MAPDFLSAKGWLTKGERLFLKNLASSVKSGVILEVGAEYGASTVCFRVGSPQATIVSIDWFQGDVTLEVHRRELARWKVSNTVQFVGDSRVVGKLWRLPVDLLLIDGGHTYSVVKADIENFVPWIKPGCVVAFHDYHGAHCLHAEVRKAVDEWVATHTPDVWAEIPSVDSIRPFRRLV